MDDLNPTEYPERGEPPSRRSSRRPVLLALAVLAAAGVGTWFLLTREDLPPPQEQPTEEPARAEAPAPAGPVLTSAESDALLRERLSALSQEPEWAAWLEESDLLRRFTGVIAAFAEGESPRPLVGFLAPREGFQVREEKGRTFIAPASYARYDAIGRVVGSLDARALASVFRGVRPTVEALYREGARPGSTLDDALRRAFDRVLDVPVLEGDVEVVSRGATYAFADPALEQRTLAEKHLLRMGPSTVRTLQEKVREVAAALDVKVSER
ncbi:MAG: DUF3014 domain-containing protein [Myxococcaceae bacterium]|nr:DUF3014 domain-containing protein [Myxococcaceae bacterium]MCI0672946.1 DUF3014 domain-containing protein [Myxococcaceae bacterium]